MLEEKMLRKLTVDGNLQWEQGKLALYSQEGGGGSGSPAAPC